MSSSLNVLTTTAKILHITKTDIFQISVSQSAEKIW